MACQESVEVKVEVKKEEDLEVEASTSPPSPPPAKKKKPRKPLTAEQMEQKKATYRAWRERQGRGEGLTEEQLEKRERQRRAAAERTKMYKERIRKEDPERFKEMMRRKNKGASVKKAAMTEEELKQHKLEQYIRNHAYYTRNGRWRDRPEEEKERTRKMQKEWLQNLSGEKKKRYLESVRRAQKKMIAKLKVEDPEKYKRVYGSKSKWDKKRYDKLKQDPAKWEKFWEKQKAYHRKQYANETPEKRERRKTKEKVNAARRRQKKQLEKDGVPEEEIQRRDEELKVRMWKEFDPEGEVPGSTPGYRRKKKDSPKIADFTPSQTQADNEAWFGVDDYFGSSPPPSPVSSPMPPSPSPDYSQFPKPPTTTEVQASSRYDSSTEKFRCSHCSSTFLDENERRVHIQLIHPSSCWKCPKCEEMFISPAELSQHYSIAHKRIQPEMKEAVNVNPLDTDKEFPFQCMRCPNPPKAENNSMGKFKTRLELLSHVKRSHPGSYWPCKACHLLKYSEQSLQVHLSVCRHYLANRREKS